MGDGEIVSTHEYPRSVQFAAVQQNLPQSLQPVGDQLIQAAGGRGDAVVAADVAGARSLHEAARLEEEQAAEQRQLADSHFNQAQKLWNENVAPLRDSAIPASNPAAWQAALDNMATEWGN